MLHYARSSTVPVAAGELFAWHRRPGAFERLAPPWQPVVVEERRGPPLEPGSRVTVRTRVGPFPARWVAVHGAVEPGRSFVDEQVSGPFRSWVHRHRFEPRGEGASELRDELDFELPFGPLGAPGGAYARREIDRLFAYRHRVTVRDLTWHRQYGGRQMRIGVTGATGLVGSALLPFLQGGGHDVVGLRRGAAGGGDGPRWDPATGRVDAPGAPLDAVVHLAGENIAGGRWNAARKARIRDSRVDGTGALCRGLAALDPPPATLVAASAVGFYGDRGDERLDESSPAGTGFLADVCQQWEAAAAPARDAGIRVVHLRIGIVLTPAGGALGQMLLPFKLGAGGVIGSGRQFMSWIALDDLIATVLHALSTDGLAGPVNAVAPNPVTNAEFTKTLGRVLRRPTILPMPAFGARLAFGEMADHLLLGGARIEPSRLRETGFDFGYPDLEGALRHLLGR